MLKEFPLRRPPIFSYYMQSIFPYITPLVYPVSLMMMMMKRRIKRSPKKCTSGPTNPKSFVKITKPIKRGAKRTNKIWSKSPQKSQIMGPQLICFFRASLLNDLDEDGYC